MAKEQENKPTEQPNTPLNEEQAAQSVAADAKEIIGIAKEKLREGSQMVGATANVADSFNGLPMDTLIAAPLIATAEAQQKLSATAWDFYQKIAFDPKEEGKARTVDFTIQRPITQDGKMVMVPQKVTAPFIGLVPIPSLLVDHVDVDFQMEVTDTQVEKNETTAEADVKASAKWFVFHADLNGKVSTSRENTRTTNQTAKYQIHVSASQQPPTEGLSKLMDIMASCIEPTNIESKE